ncbi:MAG: hypothetical protein ACRDLY_11055 [Thermoleophilaceae bacterium]
MEEFDCDYGEMPPLRVVLDGARQFGLTDGELVEAIDVCVYEVGTDATVAELLDELTGALARSILTKQRRTLSKENGAAAEEQRTRSRDPR